MSSRPQKYYSDIARATATLREDSVLQAELLFAQILKEWPGDAQAVGALVHLALMRDDTNRAFALFKEAVALNPQDESLSLNLAELYVGNGHSREAIDLLTKYLNAHPKFFLAWLSLGEIHERNGNRLESLRSFFKAIRSAQSQGHWKDRISTAEHLVTRVLHAVNVTREGAYELLRDSYGAISDEYGSTAVARVDLALAGILNKPNVVPQDERQKPKFLYIPNLPSTPYLDPFLQPWASRLKEGYSAIKIEALDLLKADQKFEDFIAFPPNANRKGYLEGDALNPTWEAFFFYRHGKRYDENHARCPQTSAVLDSLDLYQVTGHGPEICFSVLRPGTHIMPHFGVTNARVVMHLPLIVPIGCALNVIDAGEHKWAEGEPMMFDDTYQHEAWNRSDAVRVILLMDCWNPHLSIPERKALKNLFLAFDEFQEFSLQ